MYEIWQNNIKPIIETVTNIISIFNSYMEWYKSLFKYLLGLNKATSNNNMEWNKTTIETVANAIKTVP